MANNVKCFACSTPIKLTDDINTYIGKIISCPNCGEKLSFRSTADNNIIHKNCVVCASYALVIKKIKSTLKNHSYKIQSENKECIYSHNKHENIDLKITINVQKDQSIKLDFYLKLDWNHDHEAISENLNTMIEALVNYINLGDNETGIFDLIKMILPDI